VRFLVQKYLAQLFSSYVLALAKEFWQRSTFLQKRVRKMLMKLIIVVNFISILRAAFAPILFF
jgi:hypothetical protein